MNILSRFKKIQETDPRIQLKLYESLMFIPNFTVNSMSIYYFSLMI